MDLLGFVTTGVPLDSDGKGGGGAAGGQGMTRRDVLKLTGAFGLVNAGLYMAIGRTGGDFTYRKYDDWGTIVKVENFHATPHGGKSPYQAYADITTDKYVFRQMPLSKFPEGRLFVGDRIGELTCGNDVRQESFYVRNDQMLGGGKCMHWMPCFDKKLKETAPRYTP